MDQIFLRDLEISCIIGIYPHERERKQNIYLDICVDFPLALSAASDNIADTLDYDKLASLATELAQKNGYQLIETLAFDLAEAIFNSFPPVTGAKITVKKPAAVPKAKYAAVTIQRERK